MKPANANSSRLTRAYLKQLPFVKPREEAAHALKIATFLPTKSPVPQLKDPLLCGVRAIPCGLGTELIFVGPTPIGCPSQIGASGKQTSVGFTPALGGIRLLLLMRTSRAPVHEAAASAPLRKVSTKGAKATAPRTKRRRSLAFAAISGWSVATGLVWSFMFFTSKGSENSHA